MYCSKIHQGEAYRGKYYRGEFYYQFGEAAGVNNGSVTANVGTNNNVDWP